MKYRKFGTTGWSVSVLTFGAWQLGGTWGAVGKDEGVSTLLEAFDQGINFVDTAAAYGSGRSEEVVGAALKCRPHDEIYVATKVLPAGRLQGQTDFATIDGQYPRDYVIGEVEASLRRLGRDQIDLLQLHLWVEDGLRILDWLEPLLALVVAGKVKKLGVSLPDIRPDSGVELVLSELVASVQVMFNMFEQAPMDNLFPAAARSGTAVIARVPFDSGSLTGTWSNQTYSSWAVNDKRREMYRCNRFAETLGRVDALRPIIESCYGSLAEAALQFCLSESIVSTIACGMRSREEVRANARAIDAAPMPPEMRTALNAHRWPHNFY